MSKDKRDTRSHDHPRDSKRTHEAKRQTIDRKRERAHKARMRESK